MKMDKRTESAFGPRDAKQPGSVEWCYQTADWLKSMWYSKQLTDRTFKEVILEILEHKVYEKIPEGQPYGSLDALLKTEIGLTYQEAKSIITGDEKGLNELDEVEQEQGKRGAPIGNHNASKTNFDNIQDCFIPQAPTGTSRQAGLRRLRKDRPDLHTRVLAQQISVNAAMVEAGFRPKTLTIPVDPERAAMAIKRQFSREQLIRLIELLQK